MSNNTKKRMETDSEKYHFAVKLLRGSEGYRAASLISFSTSIAVLFWAIFSVEMSKEQRVISTLTVFYLVSSTFTLAKTIRDRQMSKAIDFPLLAGTAGWFWQCVISFCVAFLSCVYAALVVEAPEIAIDIGTKSIRSQKEPIGFLLIGLSFALSSTLSMAQMVRDRQDALYYLEDKNTDAEAKQQSLLNLVKGSQIFYGAAIWSLFLFDVVAFLYSVSRFHLSNERIDLLILGVSFVVYACFILAKAIRDNLSKEDVLHPTAAHWFMYVVAPIVAMGLTMAGLLEIPLSLEQKAFMVLNIVCIMSVTFSLAKVVRDRQEVERL